MSVIINEFEIVMDNKQEETTSESPTTAEEAQAPTLPSPGDIRDIVQHQLARLERLWAH